MANNSYGWVNPVTQPSIPVNNRYAPQQAQNQQFQNQMQAQQNQVGNISRDAFNAMSPADQQARSQYLQQQSQQNQSAYQQAVAAAQGQNRGGSYGGQVSTAAFGGPETPIGPGRVRDPNQGGNGGSDVGLGSGMGQFSGYPGVSGYGDLLNRLGNPGGNGWSNLASFDTWTGGNRSAAEDYMNNFVVPYGNLVNAQNTLGLNAALGLGNLTEQQRVNTGQMNLAQQQQDLSKQGFNFATGPQFQEGIRQFNAQQGIAQQQQNDLGAFQRGQIGNQATDIANQYNLGSAANANTLLNYQNQFKLGNAANANQANDIANQFALGNAANANQLTGLNQQYALGKQSNANTLLNYQNQFNLGQGQLGYQNRQLDTTNAFNQQQLAQEAALTREKYQNDLTQARYGAFGRAQAPNARALMTWK